MIKPFLFNKSILLEKAFEGAFFRFESFGSRGLMLMSALAGCIPVHPALFLERLVWKVVLCTSLLGCSHPCLRVLGCKCVS